MKPVNSVEEIGSLALWSAYCDKKMECEQLTEKLEQCYEMLVYAHQTSEQWYDNYKVSKFVDEMKGFLDNAAN